MKQIDYIKIKVENVLSVNTKYLIDHPTIKNRYKLNFPTNGFNGNTLYGNNIDIYYHNQKLYVDFSTPYLLYGHNYISLETSIARKVIQYLSDLLSVNLFFGRVIIFEIGEIFHTQKTFEFLRNNIVGVDKMELQKKSNSILIYGYKNIQFKIYHINKNLKRKLPKTVLDSIHFQKCTAVKTELKFNRDKQYTVEQFLNYGFDDSLKLLETILNNQVKLLGTNSNCIGNKFDDILYHTLQNIGDLARVNIDKMILDTINQADLSHSKRTARRNSLKAKQVTRNKSNKTSLMNLLRNRGTKESFSGPSNHQLYNLKTVNHV